MVFWSNILWCSSEGADGSNKSLYKPNEELSTGELYLHIWWVGFNDSTYDFEVWL